MTRPLISQPVVRFHRNGTHGKSFHLVAFKWGRGKTARRLLATVFGETEGDCAVVDPAAPGECWDGPFFESTLREAIATASSDPATYRGGCAPTWQQVPIASNPLLSAAKEFLRELDGNGDFAAWETAKRNLRAAVAQCAP